MKHEDAFAENKGLTWEKIYRSWNRICQDICPHLLCGKLFREVKIIPDPDPDLRIKDGVVDWWPTEEIESRIKTLNEFGIAVDYLWHQYVGVKNTADLLWNYKDNKEIISLIWIYTFLRELDRLYLREWGKEAWSLLDMVHRSVKAEMDNKEIKYYWHSNTKRFLPTAIDKNIYKSPSNIDDLLYIICLDVLLIMTSYTLVYVSNETNVSKSELLK